MKTYLVLAFSDPAGKASKDPGGMEAWGEWMKKYDGQIADMGAPLSSGVEGSKSGGFNTIKPDQWPAEGYMMIMAADMAAAQAMVQDSPLDDDMPLRIFEKAEMMN